MAQGGVSKNKGKQPFDVEFVVNGETVRTKAKPEDTVGETLEEALRKSQNTGQGIDRWEVKDLAGKALALAATFAALGIFADTKLYASLMAGGAG